MRRERERKRERVKPKNEPNVPRNPLSTQNKTRST